MIPFVRPEGPLLTVGIPTYNRATTLRACLARLLEDLEPHAAYVEVIVSDNASDDDTDRVLSECRDLWRDRVHLRCIRNSSNVGVSRNVVSLFYAAATPYFMFLGDDDCLSPTALPGLRRFLQTGASRRSSSVLVAARDRIRGIAFGPCWHRAHRLSSTRMACRPLRQIPVHCSRAWGRNVS